LNKIITCVSVEINKFFSSKVPIISLLSLTFVPFMGGFFMFVLKDPLLAKKLGFISTKANIVGTADWSSYINLLTQAISIGGILVFGFITSWVFGREYTDKTIKDLLALPISRNIIVISKFVLIILWCLILSVHVLILGFIIGKIVNIPGFTPKIILDGISLFIFCSSLTILLSTPVALFASISGGYLSPLAFTIFTLILAQIIAITGYGHLFPWSIPPLLSGIDGENVAIGIISILIVLLTSAFGILSTLLQWKYGDQNK